MQRLRRFVRDLNCYLEGLRLIRVVTRDDFETKLSRENSMCVLIDGKTRIRKQSQVPVVL